MPSIEIADLNLIYRDDTRAPRWSIQIKDIVLIAEYTTNEGPWADDYFLVFVTIEGDKAFFSECSFYVAGMDDVLGALKQQFNIFLEHQLLHSTEWASRVLWPVQMTAFEYFKFNRIKSDGIVPTLRQALFGSQLEYALSDPVREFIQGALSRS